MEQNNENGIREKEQGGNAFERQLKRQKRRRIVKAIVTIIVLAVLAGAGWYLYQYMEKMSEKTNEQTSTTVYRAQRVSSGSVTTTLSSSGSLSPVSTETKYASYDSTVESVNVSLLQEVKEGDILMTLTLDEDNELLTQLDELEETMESTDRVADTKYIKSSSKGVVKDIKVVEGSDVEAVMEEYGYLARVALDGLMKVELSSDLLHKYDKVTVKYGKLSYDGVVQELKNGVSEIIVEETRPVVGETAEVYTKDGELAGTGVWDLVSYAKITGVDGYVKQVCMADNTKISRNGKFCLCSSYPVSDQYVENLETFEDFEEDIEEATVIRAPFDGRILEIDVKAGDDVGPDSTLLVVQSLEGYIVTLSVDELDIASLKIGQPATVELDAIEGKYEGTLDYISYVNASSGNVVRYTAEVRVGDIAGALPSMSATCEIVTSSSGEGLLVPAEAIQMEAGKMYVYKAPADSQPGMSYSDTELDVSTLEKVDVTVVQSDGSKVLVAGSIADGDMILTKIVTTNAVYSSSSSSSQRGIPNMGSMPNMGGGNFGGFGGSNGSGSRSGNGGSGSRSGGSNSGSRSGNNRG